MADSASRNRTRKWFTRTTLALLDLRSEIDKAILAAPQEEKNGWLIQRGRVQGMISMVRDFEEEFEAQNLEIRPPDQATIDETINKVKALADKIGEVQKAQAILALVTDLGEVLSKVLA